MSGLETAIRNALDRSDRGNPETRARIYQSARLALESGLRKQDVTDPDIVSQQRQRLETVIHSIEAEERFALGNTAGKVVPQPTVQAETLRQAEQARAAVARERMVAPEPAARLDSRDGDIRADRLRGDGRAPRQSAPAVESDRSGNAGASPPRFWGRSQREEERVSGREDDTSFGDPMAGSAVVSPLDRPSDRPTDRPDNDPLADFRPSHGEPAGRSERERAGHAEAEQNGEQAAGHRDVDLGADLVAVDRHTAQPDASLAGTPMIEAPLDETPLVETPSADRRLRSRAPQPEKITRSVKPRKASQPERRERRKRRSFGRWLFSTFLVLATLAGGVGGAAWWLDKNGLLQPLLDPDAEVPVQFSENADGAGAGLKTLGKREGFSTDWLQVFVPTQSAAVVAGGAADTEVVTDEAGPRLRIASTSSGPEGEVAVTVPSEMLSELSGKTSTVAVTVQGADGKSTEFYIECDFASMGNCGRHRFTVHGEKVDMLFQVRFDRTLAPGTPGRLLINSDVSGKGASLNLYAIRLLPGT